MEYRKIADTDLELPVITFGAWAAGGWMWGRTERKDAVEAIRASYDLGVTAIDTAPVYGQGTSEEIVGEAIKGLDRSRVQILTKIFPLPSSVMDFDACCRRSISPVTTRSGESEAFTIPFPSSA